jgi:hypothetical protein
MKIKLLSLLMCACVMSAVLSGCKSDSDCANSSETAEHNPYANVYGVKEITDPDSFFVPESSYVRGDRLYMPCTRNSDNDASEMTILSMDFDGGDLRFEPYESKIDGAQLVCVKALRDGSTVYVEVKYVEKESIEYIVKENADGSEAFSIVMENSYYPRELRSDTNRNFIKNVTSDDDGNIYFLTGCGVSAFSPNGDYLFSVSAMFPKSLASLGDKVALLQYDYGKKEHTLAYIGATTKRLSENVTIHGATDLDDELVIFEKTPDDTSDYLHYLTTAAALFGVREDGADEIVNWANSGIAPGEIRNVTVLGGGKIFYANFDWTSWGHIYMLTAIPEDEVPRRIQIDLACLDGAGATTSRLTGFVTKFNMKNSKYIVNLIPYVTPSNSEMTEVDLFNNDLILGNIPDMFLFGYYNITYPGFKIENYENKGMFADLYEYINNDPDFPRDSLLGCTMTPFESNGKLYRFAYTLYIESLACTTETAATLGEWSITDFLDRAEECASRGVSLLYAPTRNFILNYLENYITEFVDEANGTCTFDGVTFLRLLKYIESLPVTTYNGVENDANTFGYREGSILLRPFRLTQLSELLDVKAAFGVQNLSELAFVGFPGGEDATITEMSSFAISALSDEEVRDGAWEFIKFLLTEDDLYELGHEISAVTADLEPLIEDMIRYYGVDIDAASARFTQSDGDFTREYITSLKGTTPMDPTIVGIVYEETQIFLGGVKSAEETAKIIQSRVAIYLSERN